jgi:CRISPR-associated endonuclease/helicase Cas3
LPAVAGSEIDFAIVEWAVAGHHPGHDRASPPRTCPAGAGAELRILAGHPRMPEIVAWLKGDFLLPGDPPRLVDSVIPLVGAGSVFAVLSRWAKAARKLWDGMNPEDRRFVAAVKDSLIAADVAGSALPRAEANEARRWQWIADAFAALPEENELQQILESRAKSFRDSDPEQDRFQSDVAASVAPVTFVKAGCGTGKTFAAYKWAATHHARRRLFFCYPTTGTATEGFRDYLYEPDVRADLFHSRRDVDFDIILTTGADSRDADRDAAVRVESLDAWATPIVACTVDTVLGIVQNNKRGRFSWPALAQSAFVFDEIHAYDDLLFGALLRFLRDLPGLPALLMTASLPKAREEALRQTLRDRSINRGDLAPIPGPKSLEDLPRYHKADVKGIDPLPLVKETLDAGGKVLWVCNTVGRVMDAAKRAEAIGLEPFIYHSRFRYEDRVNRHRDVIEAFKPGSGAALAICSQVAEMSLDLSADLLVTDLAPVPSLIQRLGRLNRRARKPGDTTGPFVVIEVGDEYLPYTPAELAAARSWLGRLPGERIKQRDLADHWEQSAENPPDLVPSAWLDGGPTTTVRELREASPGITVILNTQKYPDYDRLLRYDERMRSVRKRAEAEGRKPTPEETKPRDDERDRLAAVILPMPSPPRGLGWRGWDKYKGIPVVPGDEVSYDPIRGAEWRK